MVKIFAYSEVEVMVDLIIKIFIIFTYFCIGLYIAKINLNSKEFWEKIKNYPYREQITDDQIRFVIYVMCAFIWPWFVLCELIRKLR